MDWWRLHSALLKYLLTFECCSQETQQRRTAGERQLGKDAALHQIFGYPMSQGTWPEAICCGHWGHGQPGSVNTTWLFCYIPFPFSVIGRLLEHASEWWISSTQVRLWFTHGTIKRKNSGCTASTQVQVSSACILVKSGF